MKKNHKKLKITVGVLIGSVLLYLFLIAPRLWNRPDTSGLEGYHYAHRGYYDQEAGIPENSLPAFQAAVDAGYGIELDVQLSSDGIPMVIHDPDLERLCGVAGKVWDYTCAELQQMTLLDTGERIPTLEEALAVIGGQVPIIVEHKMDKVDTAVCEKAYAVLREYEGAYCVESFHPLVLLWYRQHAPEVIRGQLAQEYWKVEKFQGKPLYTVLSFLPANVATRPDFIGYAYGDASNLSLRLCRVMGAMTMGWTVESPEAYEEAKGQFDAVIFGEFPIKDCD